MLDKLEVFVLAKGRDSTLLAKLRVWLKGPQLVVQLNIHSLLLETDTLSAYKLVMVDKDLIILPSLCSIDTYTRKYWASRFTQIEFKHC